MPRLQNLIYFVQLRKKKSKHVTTCRDELSYEHVQERGFLVNKRSGTLLYLRGATRKQKKFREGYCVMRKSCSTLIYSHGLLYKVA